VRILCLCKRQPLGRDLWREPYGRFYHLAAGLAAAGHEVHMVLANYRGLPPGEPGLGGLHWHSVPILPDPTRYDRYARRLALQLSPDWVLGLSDTWFAIAADRAARAGDARCLIDAYDNYEAYMPWFGWLHRRYRQALGRCDLLTAAGPGLLAHMGRFRDDLEQVGRVLPMAADPGFEPGDRQAARASLALPADPPILLYSGSLFRNRGVEVLLEACRRLEQSHPQLRCLFCGRLETGLALPGNVTHLGYVDDTRLKALYQAADLLVSVNLDSDFGAFSYPVKLYEALAVGLPVVASETPSTRYVLRDYPDALVPPGDAGMLATRIGELLSSPYPVNAAQAGWADQVALLNSWLEGDQEALSRQ
jgi:glycosyltransferase involved in cell wall biosynthesis